jgi:hypothetical protein
MHNAGMVLNDNLAKTITNGLSLIVIRNDPKLVVDEVPVILFIV